MWDKDKRWIELALEIIAHATPPETNISLSVDELNKILNKVKKKLPDADSNADFHKLSDIAKKYAG